MADEQGEGGRQRAEIYRRSPGGPVWYEEEPESVSLLQIASFLLRHRWKLLGVPVLVAALAVGVTVLQEETFTADASFVPHSGQGMSGQLSQLSGVASQFGINLPRGTPGQSPQFYADLLTSRRLLEEAVTHRYRRAGPDGGSDGGAATDSASQAAGVSLIELYGITGTSRAEAVAAAASRLEEAVSVSMNAETGVVELSVTTRWPTVSKQVADHLIELVNQFNNRVRQSQASAEAEFVRERLAEARDELRAAEDSLQRFLQRNVGWQQSPELQFQYDRLQRRVSLKQQVYTSLASRYEEARISEVKTTPVVTAVTRPQVPVRADSWLFLTGIIGLLVGAILGGFWALGSEFVSTVREENSDHYREFRTLGRDAAADVKQVGRRLRRMVGGDP